MNVTPRGQQIAGETPAQFDDPLFVNTPLARADAADGQYGAKSGGLGCRWGINSLDKTASSNAARFKI